MGGLLRFRQVLRLHRRRPHPLRLDPQRGLSVCSDWEYRRTGPDALPRRLGDLYKEIHPRETVFDWSWDPQEHEQLYTKTTQMVNYY